MSYKNEILDNYNRILSEMSFKKQAADKKVKDIANLYNVKNEKPADMEYEGNIVEMAHPESVVLFQSHDKINSLIENVNERQNIIINILRKTPNGNITQKKYAQDLALTLIRVAADMDNKDNEQLSILADVCAEQLSNKLLKKEAIAPLAAGIVGAVAIAGGLIYLKNHTNFTDRGLEKNGIELLTQINDLVSSGTGQFSLRSEYSDNLKAQLAAVDKEVRVVLQAYSEISSVINQLEAPKTLNQEVALLENAKKISNKPEITKLYQNFKALAQNITPMLTQLEENFSSEGFKNKETKNEGFGGKINDFFGGVFYGGKGLVADEFDDVVHAIVPFKNSMIQTVKYLYNAESAEKKAVEDLRKSQGQVEAYEDAVKPAPAPDATAPAAQAKPSLFTLDGIEQELLEMQKSYTK